MNLSNLACLIVSLSAVALAAAAIIGSRLAVLRTVNRLDRMLQDAIDGTFSEQAFDESRLSALEARMMRYLSECAVSSKNLLTEKETIKALISDISHQTKTPIANILLYAQLLSEHELPEVCRPCVEALSSQAEKLNFLIGALVKTSRLETGIIRVKPELCGVEALLQQAAEPVLPKAEAKGITLSLPEADAKARFDPKWTAEAVGNLLDNAVKYAPEGSEITVTVRPYELFCRIDVQDQGIGILPEEQSRIFQRFYRSPAVADREGVGIGLYLTREILAAQGGFIKVQSEPGQGSTFSVFLPQAQ